LKTSTADNKCLDIPYNNQVAGTQLQQWDCNNGDSQKFIPVENGDGTFSLKSTSGLCVDAFVSSNPMYIGLWSCHGDDNQKFRWQSGVPGRIVVKANNACFDITGASKASGALAQVYDCNSGSAEAQTFSIVYP
jgi:hypothetical protein